MGLAGQGKAGGSGRACQRAPAHHNVVTSGGYGMDDGPLILARHKLDVDDYYRMAEAGIIGWGNASN